MNTLLSLGRPTTWRTARGYLAQPPARARIDQHDQARGCPVPVRTRLRARYDTRTGGGVRIGGSAASVVLAGTGWARRKTVPPEAGSSCTLGVANSCARLRA
ncbi:MAG TPA: hypothetical protein VIM14_07685, partial [Polyangia bacterium]